MVLKRTVRCVLYIALLLTAAAGEKARAQDFLSCTSRYSALQSRQAEYRTTHVKEIFSRLTHVEVFLLDSEAPRISIEPDTRPNAFVRDSKEVVITEAALEVVESSSELAFILAHELSHIALGHLRPGAPADELQADRLALSLVRRAGFDPCASQAVLARLGTPYAASLESLAPRLRALEVMQAASCRGLPLLTPHQHYRPVSAGSPTIARQSAAEVPFVVPGSVVF
jgi:Zn-dependent protease with chaperone function